MSELWAVGIDGGGTKTAAAARRLDGTQELRSSRSGPCSVSAMTAAEAFANVLLAIDQLGLDATQIGAISAGIAGYSAVEKRNEFIAMLHEHFPDCRLEIVPDYFIVHSAAFDDGAGVTVIAGTGSIVFGMNRAGERAVCGGYGYLIDDLGSGYGLGRQVLAAAGRAFDGTTGHSALTEFFVETTGIQSREQMVDAVYGGGLDRPSVAALSLLVSQAAKAGDSVADGLLMHTGGALARIAQTAIARLFPSHLPVTVCRAGSLWDAGGELDAVFERSLRRSHPPVSFTKLATPPVFGALRMALGHGIKWNT